MKPTKKIRLELYSDKTEQFYLSLLRYKLSEKPDLETLKSIADAIYYDKDILLKSLEPTEEQRKIINDKLYDVHSFLLNSKKDSSQYFTVSKENFEKFQASSFGEELRNVFFMVGLMEAWKGKEENAEIKSLVAVMSFLIAGLTKGITESIGKSINTAFNAAQALNDNISFNVKPNKKGNLIIKTDTETVEAELFAEKSGQIRKIKPEELETFTEENILFIKTEESTIRIKIVADNIEITRYGKVKVKNQKLDLSKAAILETITVSKELYEKGFEDDGEGNISINPAKAALTENSTVTAEAHETIVYNYEDILKEQGEKKGKESKQNNFQFSDSVFATLDDYFTTYLKFPEDNPQKIQARDRIIINIYEILKEHYPNLTVHAYTTITGFIASKIELLDSEEAHGEKMKRNQPYRKYLRDTVYNILRSNYIIKN